MEEQKYRAQDSQSSPTTREYFIHAQIVGYEQQSQSYVLGLDDGKFLAINKALQTDVDGLVGKIIAMQQDQVQPDEENPDLFHCSYNTLRKHIAIRLEKLL